MKISEAIAAIDSVKKANNYSVNDKVGWLSELDSRIVRELFDRYEGTDKIVFSGYDADDTNVELLVKAPYEGIYTKWLEARIDYANGEYDKYNNSAAAFNSVYGAFERDYNYSHMPKAARFKFF